MTNIKEEIKELHFAACPTDTEEPFYWKWNEHGLAVLEAFFKSKFEERDEKWIEILDAMAFEQDNGHKVELFINWDDAKKKLINPSTAQ